MVKGTEKLRATWGGTVTVVADSALETHRAVTVAGTRGAQVTQGVVNAEHRVRTAGLNHRGWASLSSRADLPPHGWCILPSWPANLCSPFFFPKDLEGAPASKKMKLEASQQNSEEM